MRMFLSGLWRFVVTCQRFEPALLAEIRRRIALAELVGGAVTLKPVRSGEYRGLCPFHSEAPRPFT